MPDRFATNTAHVEELLDQLGLALPARVARSRALISQVGELDVVNAPPLSRDQLAQRTVALLEVGQNVDLIEIVQRNAAIGLTGEADALLRAMTDHVELLQEQAIRGAAPELLSTARAETVAIFDQGRQFGDTPTNAQDAVEAGAQAVKAFQAFKTLGDRYGKLRALHAEIIAGYVDATAFAWFRDTKCWPTFTTGKAEPAGPVDPLRRLLWLATPEAKAWVPSGPECTAYYFEVLRDMQKPTPPATVLSATTTTARSS